MVSQTVLGALYTEGWGTDTRSSIGILIFDVEVTYFIYSIALVLDIFPTIF